MTSSPSLYTVLKIQNLATFPRMLVMLNRSAEEWEESQCKCFAKIKTGQKHEYNSDTEWLVTDADSGVR